jgi:2-hydroxy-3-keto-5-methylthiopentenyl-1-phosphate phosphatase
MVEPTHVAVMSDFDGTISPMDTNVEIWKAGVDRWEERYGAWQEGLLPEREHMAAQYCNLRLEISDLLQLVDSFPIDETFIPFANLCGSLGWHLEVISSGTVFIIRRVLAKYGLDLPVIANELVFEKGKMRIEFPHSCHPGCLNREAHLECATCKCLRFEYWRSKGMSVVFIGDGGSDIGLVRYLLRNNIRPCRLFAKSQLADFCKEHDVHYIPFDNFGDIITSLSADSIPGGSA